MKALGWTTLAFGFLMAITAHAGDEAAQKKEKAALQGVWTIKSLESNKGKDDDAVGATLEFDKEGKNVVFTKGNETKKGTFTLNPAAKPKEIDIKPVDENKTFEGIYVIDKDMLKICLAPDSNDGRPTELALKDGKNYILITLERSK